MRKIHHRGTEITEKEYVIARSASDEAIQTGLLRFARSDDRILCDACVSVADPPIATANRVHR